MIVGRLFPAELSEFVPGWEPVITERDAARYLDTAGRQLTEDYWGSYIAFLASPTEPWCAVLRDPSGKLPCYRMRHGEVDVLFSDSVDLSPLPLPPFTLSLPYLGAFIYMDSLQVRASALAEVSEVLAGECFEVRRSSARQLMAWDAASAATGCPESHYEQAAMRLRDTTQGCIDAWASVHGRVLHCLSGGLDSSIVLGCLSRAPSAPDVICINHYVDGVEGDERDYARIAAASAGVPLIESRWTAERFAFDARLFALPRTPKPGFSQCARLMQLETINQLACRHQADAVWKGQGGDHLFLKTSSIPSATDYLADRGVGWGLARAVRDAARHSLQPYTSILASALSSRRIPRRWSGAHPGERKAYFVRRDALPDDLENYLAHPWTVAAEELPPGRQCQVRLLAEVVNRHRPLSRSEFAYEHHPLLSQPVFEQCLRIPTYLHLKGGRHRALAREAFRDRVPQQIIQREGKGATTSLTVESIRTSDSFLCELLLDGVLVGEGVADKAELENCLRDGHVLTQGQLPALLACIAAEIWARAWRGAVHT